MGIRLEFGEESDLAPAWEIMKAAFESDPINLVLYPHGRTAENDEKTLDDWRKEIESEPYHRFVKAVDDETGEMMGWAKWYLYLTERAESEWNPPSTDKSPAEPSNFASIFFGMLAEKRKKIFAGNPYCFLKILVTHPTHQRKGAGYALTKWGCNVAIEKGLPMYVEASNMGHPLYRRCGFEDLEKLTYDLRPYGGKVSSFTLMIGQPTGVDP
ncbi:MAG: hypothetical protein M1838_005761 [Thelocarpon superellum]|nr:MAG: hypothetical protein M1838_005761 [Thelocarpon superellum]